MTRRALTYPVGESLALVRAAGGISKLPADVRATLVLKTVEPGDWCDDLPAESLEGRIARGDVECVESSEDTWTDLGRPEGGA